MNKKWNIFANIFQMVLILIGIYFSLNLSLGIIDNRVVCLLIYVGSAIVVCFLTAFFHELGHYFSAKKNGFNVLSFNVWFLSFEITNNGKIFSFNFSGEEAGSTKILPKNCDNLEGRFARVSSAGLISSFIIFLLGFCIMFMRDIIPNFLFIILSTMLPVGIYYFFGNAIPMTSDGVRNDGAVIYGIKHNSDDTKVILSLLKIHGEMFNGKTPAEIDESFYFDLPQLPEDNPYFAILLNARYNYYLDKNDFDNANRVMERLYSIEGYLSKSFMSIVNADNLFDCCTFNYDDKKADYLVSDNEKYLNGSNNLTNLRIKSAYILNVRGERELFDDFYNRAVDEASNCQILGLVRYEKSLLDRLKNNFYNVK